MCGIIGYAGSGSASQIILDGINTLSYRGYDSSGIALVGGSRQLYLKRALGVLVSDPDAPISHLGIGHTRWATHGKASVENAHPHTDCSGRIAVVHNGTIENYRELREMLIAKGHVFRSETDTEVIPHLLEYLTIEDVIGQLRGTFALLVLDVAKQTITAVCRRCPLLLTKVASGIVISSGPVVSGEQCVLPDENPAIIGFGGTIIKNPTSGRDWLSKRFHEPPRGYSEVSGSSPESGLRMLDEIQEQPGVLLRAAAMDGGLLQQVAIDMLRAERIVFTASGTSRYAALIGRYMISRGTSRLGDVIASSEFPYFAQGIHQGTTVVAVSQSGETADIVEGVRIAKERGAWIIGITNSPGSLLTRMSDQVIDTECGPEYSVAATKTFTGQLAAFYLLRGAILGELDIVRMDLSSLATAVGNVIRDQDEAIRGIAKMTVGKNDFYYLARGINFAVAGESALKMKEVSYIHAEGMAAGELKHGTLALVSDGTLVCGICPNDYTYPSMELNLREVKARGGTVIGITDAECNAGDSVFDRIIRLPQTKDIYYPVLCAVVTQMLAYYAALERGINPCRPRNLAKSVTVL